MDVLEFRCWLQPHLKSPCQCYDTSNLLRQLEVLKRLNNSAGAPLCGLQGTQQGLAASTQSG